MIDIDCDYMELSMEDVPDKVRHLINQEMLDKYNKELPSKEVIENYKNERRFYERVKQDSVTLLGGFFKKIIGACRLCAPLYIA